MILFFYGTPLPWHLKCYCFAAVPTFLKLVDPLCCPVWELPCLMRRKNWAAFAGECRPPGNFVKSKMCWIWYQGLWHWHLVWSAEKVVNPWIFLCIMGRTSIMGKTCKLNKLLLSGNLVLFFRSSKTTFCAYDRKILMMIMIAATIILMEIFGYFDDNDDKNYWKTTNIVNFG